MPFRSWQNILGWFGGRRSGSAVLSSTPLQILNESPPQVPWTETQEADYQQLLTSLLQNPARPLTDKDRAILLALREAYGVSGQAAFYDKIVAIFNIPFEAFLLLQKANNNNVNQTRLDLHTINYRFPVMQELENILTAIYQEDSSGIKKRIKKRIVKRFARAITNKFGELANPDQIAQNILSHPFEGAPK